MNRFQRPLQRQVGGRMRGFGAVNQPLPIDRLRALGTQRYFPQTGIEEAQGSAYNGAPGVQQTLQIPGNPGLNLPQYINPYRTIMYSVVGLSTSIPTRAIPGNLSRTYLLVQNLGPGNLYLGIGIDPNAGGQNVLNLVQSQVYEQIGGGGLLPDGTSLPTSFVSPEYISLLTDTAGTNAMIIEGSFSAAWAAMQAGG